MTVMILELLKKRLSVRQYEARSIEKEKLEALIDAARLAPTARNEQPWEFVVVTDEAKKAEIAALTDYGRFIAKAGACITVFCRETKYYLEDGSAATTYILLAATELGLGSCWIAGDKKGYAEDIKEALGVPSEYKLVSLVAVGYPGEHHPKPKRELNAMLHWEKF